MFLFDESRKIIQAVEKALPAAASILMSKHLSQLEGDYYSYSFGLADEKGMVKITGCSGFFISSDGYLLTNRHVVEDESASYAAIWKDKSYPCQILARDKITDIAILKIQGKNFPYLNLGDSSKLKLGQTVMAIGNVLGEFSNTISKGIISGLSRQISAEFGEKSQDFFGLIQTDAAINPGNSGGPLIDIFGRAIGINTATVLGLENIGFAIPINQAKDILEDIKKYGKICRPNLGIRYLLINEEVQKRHNLPFDYGAFIIHECLSERGGIIPAGPAEKAGLQEGDIILEVEGSKIDKNFNLNNALEKHQIGKTINIAYWRKNEIKNAEIKLAC